jgi:hypothetical protein
LSYNNALSLREHHCPAVDAVADAGADTSVTDDQGHNLLQYACATGDWDWVEWALRNGCRLPSQGVKGLVDALQQTSLKGRQVRRMQMMAHTCRTKCDARVASLINVGKH